MLETPKALSTSDGKNLKDITMDNQQVTQVEIGWLLGIIDGEGCFTMSPGSKGGWNVGIKLVNTDDLIIYKLENILVRLNFKYHKYSAYRTGNQRHAWRIEINGPDKLKPVLDFISQYKFAKEDQCRLLLEYCNLRISTKHGDMDACECYRLYNALRMWKRP